MTDTLTPGITVATAQPPAAANEDVRQWVRAMADMCQPSQVRWLDGSAAERQQLFAEGVQQGVFIKLNEQKLPNSYLHRSNPNDVARSEHQTYICTPSQDMAGPTNNWIKDKDAYA